MAKKVIISGGGTGGHVFPAIAIANALRRIQPDVDILFVGAEGKLEMEKVPAAGYSIVSLDIQGLNRKSLVKNLVLPFKLIKSLIRARRVLNDFQADIAVGVGGYASGPLLMMANFQGLPTLIQEQNSFAGKTNKSLGKQAVKVCVAYDGMEQFFSPEKILLTGNPVRRSSVEIEGKREEALKSFGLDPAKVTLLITGGSLGAGTLNSCVKNNIQRIAESDVQVIWQCGSYYYDSLSKELGSRLPNNIKLMPFVERMDYAYAAADLIIARAGAGTISELCVIGKPTILVPSPNVAEDHQTKNAMALVDKNATILVKDSDAQDVLLDTAFSLLSDKSKCEDLGANINKLALFDADEVIAKEIIKIINN